MPSFGGAGSCIPIPLETASVIERVVITLSFNSTRQLPVPLSLFWGSVLCQPRCVELPHPIHIPVEPARQLTPPQMWLMALLIFVVLAGFMWPVVWKDYQHFRDYPRKLRYPLVNGSIVDRYMVRYCWGTKRPLLLIRPEGTPNVVKALLIRNELFDFPTQLRVHYGGDPKDEILIEGESDPVGVTWFMGLLPVALALFMGIAAELGARRKSVRGGRYQGLGQK